MAPTAISTTRPDELESGEDDLDFTLNVRVIEGDQPGPDLRITSDECGSTCSGTACTTKVSEPA